MRLWATDIAYLITEIRNSKYKLNSWEEGFLKSMWELSEKGQRSSDKQAVVLQRIYRYSQGGGTYEKR